jgi:DNA repair protein RecO (recombination protein O)
LDSGLKKLYVLHARAYRDSSVIVDCLSEEEGLISLIAKGAKRPKSPVKAILTQFTPLLVSSYGRSELKGVKSAELQTAPVLLQGVQLFSGFYVNELLQRLLHKHDPCPAIFSLYEQALAEQFSEIALRQFEMNFLSELGYGLSLLHEIDGATVVVGEQYYFDPQVGLSNIRALPASLSAAQIFKGEELLAIAHADFSKEPSLKAAKRLMRLAFLPLLGGKPLKARELFL